MAARPYKARSHGLDRISRKILDVLENDGRITNQDLADRVGLSAAACLERTRNLRQHGYILGYRAHLNPQLLGAPLLLYVKVVLERVTREAFDAFGASMLAFTEVQECYMVSGGPDYIVKARVRDITAFIDGLGLFLRQTQLVRQYSICVVRDEVKRRF